MCGMKFIAARFIVLLATVLLGTTFALAQGPTRGRIEPPRDEAREIAAKHNLEVARYYLTKRKAYEGARDRLQEIIETYPDFSRIDEVIYLMAEAHLKLRKTDVASDYYNKLLKDHPTSELAKKARAQLEKLKEEEKLKENEKR